MLLCACVACAVWGGFSEAAGREVRMVSAARARSGTVRAMRKSGPEMFCEFKKIETVENSTKPPAHSTTRHPKKRGPNLYNGAYSHSPTYHLRTPRRRPTSDIIRRAAILTHLALPS